MFGLSGSSKLARRIETGAALARIWRGYDSSLEGVMPDLYMVFDVESIGLHGEGFAVGYVVIDQDGVEKSALKFVCPREQAQGDDEGRQWVRDNVPATYVNCLNPADVRRAFWQDWRYWQEAGAELVADCAWPVEARFLIACVDDDPARTWEGPYPLHELASFMVAAGMDPMATYDRLPDEPLHDPLGDARQSARLLTYALKRLSSTIAAPCTIPTRATSG